MINLSAIRYLEVGEAFSPEVLNRPIQDLSNEIAQGINDLINGGTYAWDVGNAPYPAGIGTVHNGSFWISKQITSQEPSDTATHWKRGVNTDSNISGATITTAVPVATTGTRNGHVWYVY